MALYKGNTLIATTYGRIKPEDLNNFNIENLQIKNLIVGKISAENDIDNYDNMNLIVTDKSNGNSYNVDINDLIQKISQQIQEENMNYNSTDSNMDLDSSYLFYQTGTHTFESLMGTLSNFCAFSANRCELTFPKNMHVKLYSTDSKTAVAVNSSVDAKEWSNKPTLDNPFETNVAAGTTLYMYTDLTSDFKQLSSLYINYYPILPYIKTEYDDVVQIT